MSLIPENAVEVEISGATVPFYRFEDNGVMFLQFDSSKAGHPEPMVNAMSGLQSIEGDEKLIMLNSKAPMGLFPKIENEFSFVVIELDDNRVKVIFSKRDNNSTTDFSDISCNGIGCH